MSMTACSLLPLTLISRAGMLPPKSVNLLCRGESRSLTPNSISPDLRLRRTTCPARTFAQYKKLFQKCSAQSVSKKHSRSCPSNLHGRKALPEPSSPTTVFALTYPTIRTGSPDIRRRSFELLRSQLTSFSQISHA